jgi:AAA+ ATPase superfamily predicted ATPase
MNSRCNEPGGKMSNPFKFGMVVSGDFFTDRVKEAKEVASVLNSGNHLILISPRRYGKTSLIKRVTEAQKRPVIYLDLQLVTDISDMASQLLKRVLGISKWESVKHSVSGFRIIPTIELNPKSDNVEISFRSGVAESFTPLDDVLGLIENIGAKGKRPIVVFDEFQEVTSLGRNLPKQLRSVIQHQRNVNYIFLGSVESMMREIFEVKKSPFYHFGHLMALGRISYGDFYAYLNTRLKSVTKNSELISKQILEFTDLHPYYTQQLAYFYYALLENEKYGETMFDNVINSIVEVHSNDFERLWNTISKTDRRILITLAEGNEVSSISRPTSTVYSGVRRLIQHGYVIKNGVYKLDDPFFGIWIKEKRNA